MLYPQQEPVWWQEQVCDICHTTEWNQSQLSDMEYLTAGSSKTSCARCDECM